MSEGSTQEMQNVHRIYYLDVLRALAISLVFMAHTMLSFGPTSLAYPLQYGGTGVDLFFLLSGWLIGSQLFAEHKKFGNIDIKRFWIRRWMRTFPAYFAVLFFTLIYLHISKDSVSSPLPYFTFTQNYFSDLPYFYVSWSLAVEEQFYLAIAPILVFLYYIKHFWAQFALLLSLLLIPSIFRSLGWYSSVYETHVSWDCCLMGVLLAFIYHRAPYSWEVLKRSRKSLLLLGFFTYLSFFYFRWDKPFDSYDDPSKLVLALVFGAMVVYAVTTPISKIPIAHSLVMHISTRSYSIYLLHPSALMLCKKILPNVSLFNYVLAAIFVSLIVSEILYRIVEMRFMNLRESFSPSQSRKTVTIETRNLNAES